VRWRVDRAFALKAVMQYLVNCKQKRITYKKIFAAHPKKGESKEFDEIKRGHMFMRENAGFDIYEEEFPHFLIAVQKVIDDNNIELPLFLREAARHAGIRVAGAIDRQRSRPLSTSMAWYLRRKTIRRWKKSCDTIKGAGRFIGCHRDRAPAILMRR
jgi:hypothetical protein